MKIYCKYCGKWLGGISSEKNIKDFHPYCKFCKKETDITVHKPNEEQVRRYKETKFKKEY